MRFVHSLRYPASSTAVLAMLTAPSFWDQVAEATGARGSETTVRRDDVTVRVLTSERQTLAAPPGFARPIIGGPTPVIRDALWTGLEAVIAITRPDKPISIRGTATVTDERDGAVLVYDLTVRAAVEVIRPKLEQLVVDLTTAGLTTENRIGLEWLTRSQ
jgi:hypothetical protein